MTFSNEVKEQVLEAQNYFCIGCINEIHSIHHRLSNTKVNRNKFPLFIHSIFNAVGLCFNCHKNESHHYKVTDKMAMFYEEVLKDIFEQGKESVFTSETITTNA